MHNVVANRKVPECPVCLFEYSMKERVPMTLMPCCHSCCYLCIGEGKLVECPSCRGRIKGKKKNFGLCEILEI